MPAGKASAVIFAVGTSVPANTTTKANPQATGTTVNLAGIYGGVLHWKIKNGASAPTVAPTMIIQLSHDGTNWYDHWTVGGDTVASSDNSGNIEIPRAAQFARAIVFGNATNAVTVDTIISNMSSL